MGHKARPGRFAAISAPSPNARPTRGERAAALAVLLAALLMLLGGLGANDLWAPDEPRYAQIAEELRSGRHGLQGWVLLHLNGEAYTQKPPLYYWLAAALGELGPGRVTEVAARLPSALAGVGLVAVTMALGRALFGRLAPGIWGGALLLTVFRFSHLARRAQLDVLLALLEALALWAFWRLESGRARRPALALAGFHGAMGLAALTKGPVGWMPLLVVAVWLAWQGRLRELARWLPPWALLLSVAPVAVWIAGAAALAPPGFLGDAVLENVFGRFFAGTSHARPIYYFVYQLPLDFLPWTLLWPLAWLGARRSLREQPGTRPAWLLLLCWALVFFVFFSLSAGKRGLYQLPAFPALALACGAALEATLTRRDTLPRLASLGLAGLGVAVLAGGLAVAWLGQVQGVALGDFTPVRLPARFGIGLALAVAAGFGLALALRRRLGSRAAPAGLLGAVAGIELCAFLLLYPAWDAEKSPRPIAHAAAALTRPDEPVGIFDHPSLAGGVVYYGDRSVANLALPRDVAAFFEDGGRVVILKGYKRPWLSELEPLEVLARARSGRREMLLVTPASAKSEGIPPQKLSNRLSVQ